MNQYTDISMIYPYEKPIYISERFLQELDERRREKYTANKNLLEDKGIVININKIEDLPNGRIRIDINGARFECFFHRGTSKRLYLILDGARTHSGGKKREIPIFNRWSYFSYTGYSWISIEDPMYFDNDDLLLGWFYGDEKRNYREYVAQIADKLSDYLEIEKNNVIFFGGSGGGTAAIHSAAIFGHGVAISINGQINFEYQYDNIERFKECTGIDLHLKDKYDRNDLCKVMKQSCHTKFILVENCRSKWDFNDHTKYFCRKLNIKPVYGIDQFENIYTWIYEAEGKSPHVAFENRNIFFALDFFAKLAVTNENIERYRSLYLLFNEFWYDLYYTKKEIPDIVFLDSKYFGACKVEVQDIIENKVIEAKDDRYSHFSYSKFKTNTVYSIKVENLNSISDIELLTVGLFDFGNKKFIIKKEYKIYEKIEFIFKVGNTVGDIGFCIFAGLHGKTAKNRLTIGKMTIYSYKY